MTWMHLILVPTASPRRQCSGTRCSSVQKAARLGSGSSFFAGEESEFSP